MAKHEIAKVWTSAVDGVTEMPKFDLTNLNDDAKNVTQCKHGNDFIHDGSIERIDDPLLPGKRCYLVRFDEPPNLGGNFQLQYRGVAIYNPSDGQFHNIVGIRKKKILSAKPIKSAAAGEKATRLTSGQDEGTWTGTQP